MQFLESYQNFVVLFKDSISVYNGKNGRLQMYLDSLAGEQNKEGFGDFSSMTFDDKHRKVFIGDINGLIRVFNVNTGCEITTL